MTFDEVPILDEAPTSEEPLTGGGPQTVDNPRVFDEARMMANVSARAQRLFDDGYRARWTGGSALAVRSPQGVVYEVDTAVGTCDCPFFQKYCNFQKQSGHRCKHYHCKHLLGYRRLLSRQRVSRLLVAMILLRVWAELDDAPNSHELPEKHELPISTACAEEPEVADVAF